MSFAPGCFLLCREVGVDVRRTERRSCSLTGISSEGECNILLEISGKINTNHILFYFVGEAWVNTHYLRKRFKEGNGKNTNVEKMSGLLMINPAIHLAEENIRFFVLPPGDAQVQVKGGVGQGRGLLGGAQGTRRRRRNGTIKKGSHC